MAALAALAVFALRASGPASDAVAGAAVTASTPVDSHGAKPTQRAEAQTARPARIEPGAMRPQRAVARPLPPADAPLAATFDVLKQRADVGDAAAASRLYRDVQRCLGAHEAQTVMSNLAKYLPAEAGDAAVVQMRAENTEIHMIADLRARVDSNAALCAAATPSQIDALVPVMLKAAQLGDLQAIDCYAAGGFDRMPGLLDHPEWLTRMRDDVPRMLEVAMRRGDWVAVELLHHASAGVFIATPAAQAIAPDPAMDFRYLSLERLGATGGFAQKLDAMLANAARGLTPQQVADADAWARDTYAKYFAGSSSNEVANGANICGAADE